MTATFRSTVIGQSRLSFQQTRDGLNQETLNEKDSYISQTRQERPSINEDRICVICFSKPIQNILPCLVRIFFKIIKTN